MRLIDADKLEDALYNKVFKEERENLLWYGTEYWMPYRMVLRVLDSMPTMMAKIEIKEVEGKEND